MMNRLAAPGPSIRARRFHVAGAPLVLAAALFVSMFVSTRVHAEDVTISGSVRDAKTRAPVAGAIVEISDTTGGDRDSVSSDANGLWSFTFKTSLVDGTSAAPDRVDLRQNYPNPFNPSTVIGFTVRTAGRMRIAVHNSLGQLLDEKAAFLTPGGYTIRWSTRGPAGMLFYSIEANGIRATRKMVQLDGGGGGGGGGLGDFALSHSISTLHSLGKFSGAHRITAKRWDYEPDSVTAADGTTADIFLHTVHDQAFVIDLHNDVLEKIMGSGYELGLRHTVNHTDIPRLREGGVDAQLFSVYVPQEHYPDAYAESRRIILAFEDQVARNSGDLGEARKPDEIAGLNGQGKIAGVLLLEGGYAIENSLENLKALEAAGVSAMTITWNDSTPWAVSAGDSRSETVGLSNFGKDVIRTMDSLSIVIDVSHTGIKTIEDILAVTRNPIIASHSGVWSLRHHTRNLTDSQIVSIARRGGVIGVVFYPSFLSYDNHADIRTVIQHIDYIVRLVGVDYVALGSDFDGMNPPARGLEDVSKFPALTLALLQHGYAHAEVRKILGENFLRVFRQVRH